MQKGKQTWYNDLTKENPEPITTETMKTANINPRNMILTLAVPAVLILAGLFLLAGCGAGSEGGTQEDISPYAGKTPADLSGYEGINEEDPIHLVETNVAEVTSLMDSKKTFAVMLSYVDCDFCQVIMPYVNEAAGEANQTVGYINTRKDPSWMTNTDIKDFDLFTEYFGEYLEQDKEGGYHLYTPDIYYIRAGKVVAYHDGVVDGYDDPSRPLTDQQQKELKENLAEEFAAMTGN